MRFPFQFQATQRVKKLLFILFLTLLSLAAAQAGPPRGGECRADIATFCSNERGQEKFLCLQEHIDEVSETCKQRLEGHAKVKAACQVEQEIFCSDTTGRDRFHCMREHRDEVSKTCREAMEAHPPPRPSFGRMN